ncbi:MAG: ArsR family transcriptional regulator [Candidatus Nanohaloarchaea archaeon]
MDCPREIKELLDVLYNLSPAETEVVYYLCEEDARVQEIAEDLGKDRSTVQRYLSTLRTAGLVKRESEAEGGSRGRHYVYSVDRQEMKQEIRDRLDQWKEDKIAVIEDL